MTFEEVYKTLYEKYEIVSFDYVDKRIKAKDSITISTYDLFELIEGLKETYAPKIKMTSEQKEQFMAFVDSPDDNFENFWFCLGSGVDVSEIEHCHFTQSEIDKLNIGSYEQKEVEP